MGSITKLAVVATTDVLVDGGEGKIGGKILKCHMPTPIVATSRAASNILPAVDAQIVLKRSSATPWARPRPSKSMRLNNPRYL